jgi:hypothetical protein
MALNAALRAKGLPEEATLQVADIEGMSLKDGLTHVLGQNQLWSDRGDELLAGTDVTFDQWRELVGRMQNGQDPQLAADKMDVLVQHGFVRRTYALAGGSR